MNVKGYGFSSNFYHDFTTLRYPTVTPRRPTARRILNNVQPQPNREIELAYIIFSARRKYPKARCIPVDLALKRNTDPDRARGRELQNVQ
jgi:hypothetical protein